MFFSQENHFSDGKPSFSQENGLGRPTCHAPFSPVTTLVAGARGPDTLQRGRPKKHLLYTKISEKSGVEFTKIRSVYEALEKFVASELLEKQVCVLPAIVTLYRRELPARAATSKTICGRAVDLPAREAVHKIRAAPAGSLKAATEST